MVGFFARKFCRAEATHRASAGSIGLFPMKPPRTPMGPFPVPPKLSVTWRPTAGPDVLKVVGNRVVASTEPREKFPKKSPAGECTASSWNAGVGVPCAEVGAGPSGAADRRYFSSSRKTGERVLLAGHCGAARLSPKRPSNEFRRLGAGNPWVGTTGATGSLKGNGIGVVVLIGFANGFSKPGTLRDRSLHARGRTQAVYQISPETRSQVQKTPLVAARRRQRNYCFGILDDIHSQSNSSRRQILPSAPVANSDHRLRQPS